jgi:hypothetical protein
MITIVLIARSRPPKQRQGGIGNVLRSAMFSTKLERRRQFNRLAVLAAATLLAVGIALIAVWAVRAFNILGAAEADRAPIIIGVLIAWPSAASHHVDGRDGVFGAAHG